MPLRSMGNIPLWLSGPSFVSMNHVYSQRSPPNELRCAGMRRNGSWPPPNFDSPSSRSPGMHRFAWRAESQTDRAYVGGQGLPSGKIYESRDACDGVGPDCRSPRRLHLVRGDFPLGRRRSDARKPDVPVIHTPESVNSREQTRGRPMHRACEIPFDPRARPRLRPKQSRWVCTRLSRKRTIKGYFAVWRCVENRFGQMRATPVPEGHAKSGHLSWG